jgi:CRP/FNR family cyclic AMP-dependent transcriptional regulator
MTTRVFRPGERIFSQGQPGDMAYFIETGGVRIWRERPPNMLVLGELGEGCLFGELALVDGRDRTANATAIMETRCSVISKAKFDEFLENHDALTGIIMASLVSYIRTTIQRLDAEFLSEGAEAP